MPTLKAIHIAKSLEKSKHKSQNLSISMSLPTLQTERKRKHGHTTMYIKNRRIGAEFKVFGSYQSLCLTESLVLRNRLLFIY
jgi:hypothetical protein